MNHVPLTLPSSIAVSAASRTAAAAFLNVVGAQGLLVGRASLDAKKFGNILTSRQMGKEAYLAFRPNLQDVTVTEQIEIDFSEVDVFSPSWGDEFLTPLMTEFGERMVLSNTDNPSVRATLELLRDLEGKKFKIIS